MKTTILVFTIIFASLFFVNSTTSIANLQAGEYDPWLDLNDDGEIDIFDVVMVATAYDTSGKAFNKTAALLELQANIVTINAIIVARIPQSDIVSISAAAFVPTGPSVSVDEWLNTGSSIQNLAVTGIAAFSASVQLPHGVTITRVTCYWIDNNQADIYCRLFKGNQTAHALQMANLDSSGSSGDGSSVSTSINYATIDNLYQYFISVILSPGHIFQYAIVEYQYPT